MRYRLVGLLAFAALLSGCAAQAVAGPTPTPPPPAASVVSSVAPSTTTPPPCGPEIRACVSLSTKQAWLMTSGVVDVGPVPITHGGATHPTPTGTWPVSWKDQEHTSSIYGDSMPYAVFFAPGGIAFHEGRLDEDSHGCVRLEMANAQLFFNSLVAGQLVQVVA